MLARGHDDSTKSGPKTFDCGRACKCPMKFSRVIHRLHAE
jgi:hypothetical protein